MTTKYFYDTEFIEDGTTIDLISIGIVADDGREYYAVSSDMPIDRILRHDWLMQNVVPTLPGPKPSTPIGELGLGNPWYWKVDRSATCVKPLFVIANEVRDFLTAESDDWRDNELWAYYGAYDHVALCQLFGTMISLPKGMPMFTHELMQLWEQRGQPAKPEQGAGAHNALEDARWNLQLYKACSESP